MDELFYEVKNTIQKYNMIKKNDVVVVGVSGGPDSICLLHILNRLKEEYSLSLYAVHLNHQFRGKDADEDALYVEAKCKSWSIPSYIKTFDVPQYIKDTGMSPEEAGREIRYKLFSEVYSRVGANKIAVAQNQNDNIETILMRFMRGSGIEGLRGIEPVRENIIRPLILSDRSLIDEYCNENNLEPRIDKTNFIPLYTRNKIRLELIPYIKNNFNPNIVESILRFSQMIGDENDFLQKYCDKVFEDIAYIGEDDIKYNIVELKKLHLSIQRRVIRMGILRLIGSLKGLQFKNIEGVIELINRKTGSKTQLPGGLYALVSYDTLILKKDKKENISKFSFPLEYNNNIINGKDIQISILRKDYKKNDKLNYGEDRIIIDESKIKDVLVYRNRNEGDVFSPIGMRGTKKLKDYFIDEKLPREERDQVELIADGNNIVWIIGKRMSEKYKVDNNTKTILEIKIIRGQKNEK